MLLYLDLYTLPYAMSMSDCHRRHSPRGSVILSPAPSTTNAVTVLVLVPCADPVLFWCWATVYDAGPTSKPHRSSYQRGTYTFLSCAICHQPRGCVVLSCCTLYHHLYPGYTVAAVQLIVARVSVYAGPGGIPIITVLYTPPSRGRAGRGVTTVYRASQGTPVASRGSG